MDYWLDEGPAWLIKSISTCSAEENKCDEELGMVKEAMKYHKGMDLLGQTHLALVDLDLHSKPLGKTETLEDREKALADEKGTRVLPQLEEDRHLNSFSHIFSGSDAAGYYSHKWADVLAADTFAAFEDTGAFKPGDEGDNILKVVGKKFADTILAHGGGRHPAQVFKMFRQREPTPKALLRYVFGRDSVAGEGAEEPLQLEELQDVSSLTGRRLTDL
jgi:oligopeptidase A